MVEFHGIEIPEEKLEEICRRYQVKELSVFGSVLREDFGKRSDIDVLVEFQEAAATSLLGYVRLERELSSLLRRRVDLVSKVGLKPLIRDHVLRQARVLYAA